MNLIDTIRKMLAPIQRRVMLMVGRAVVNLVDDSLKMQGLQLTVLEDETQGGVERFQNYGFTSVPQQGAEAILVNVGGNRDHPIVIAVDDRRYRLKGLQGGEVAMYTDQGDKIHIKRGGTIEITASSKIIANSPAIELGPESEEATLQKVLNGETFQAWFNSHQHTGGFVCPTSPPIAPSIPAHLSTVVKAAP